MNIDIRKDGALIEGFKPEYYWCGGGCCTGDTPTPPGPEPPTPDTGITAIRIIVADSITDSGLAKAEFSPATADTSLVYSSSDPEIATIHPYTGRITVLQDGVVTFCVLDFYTGLEDCKEVIVHKSIEPGPDTGETGITSIRIIVADTITDEGIATSVYEPATATTLLVYTSSDDNIAIIDQSTGEIEVKKTGFVTFCVEDEISGLMDCETVYVIKSEPGPGPEPPTGSCIIEATYYAATTGFTYVLGRNSSAIVQMESDEGDVVIGSIIQWNFKTTGEHKIYITYNSTTLEDHLFIDNVSNKESKVPITGIIIPDCITEIGMSCFWECRKLENVVLPSYLERIDDFAFYRCLKLEDILLPDTLKYIGVAAFSWDGLHTIKIPASVEHIYPEAFSYCARLETVNMLCSIPTTTEKPGEEWWGMFDYCPLLRSFTGPNASSDNKMLITNDNIAIGFAPYDITDYSIPFGVIRIATYCFEEINTLKSVTIPDSVKSIGDRAFVNSAFIETITFGSGLERIEDYAFGYVTHLNYIYSYATIAPSVKSSSFSGAGWYSEDRILYYPAGSDYSSWLNPKVSGLPSTWTGQEINDI